MKKILFFIYIFILLYTIILVLNFPTLNINFSTDYINFTCIIIANIIVLLSSKFSFGFTDFALLCTGLIFTAVGDFCLILMNYPIAGLIFFAIVQTLYSIRYSSKYKFVLFVDFILIILLSFTLAILKINDLLLFFSIFYAFSILFSCSNAVFAFIRKKYPSPTKYMIVAGMLLFLLCDINVALRNSSLLWINLYNAELSYYLIFLFYLPSQLLLSLSGLNFGHNQKK